MSRCLTWFPSCEASIDGKRRHGNEEPVGVLCRAVWALGPECPINNAKWLRTLNPYARLPSSSWETERTDGVVRTFGLPPEIPVVDLATNRPGQAARLRADTEWQKRRAEKPVRAVLGRLFDVHTDERAWRVGADGEELVGRELLAVAQRDPRWRFLHAVPVGDRGSDIDHVAIGPGGVFTINAKHHRSARIWVGGGTFIVNGQRLPYIRNSRYEAQRAARLLSKAMGAPVSTFGMIVPVRCGSLTVKTPPLGVVVIPSFDLSRWLLSLPAIMRLDQIRAIFEAARCPSTWSSR